MADYSRTVSFGARLRAAFNGEPDPAGPASSPASEAAPEWYSDFPGEDDRNSPDYEPVYLTLKVEIVGDSLQGKIKYANSILDDMAERRAREPGLSVSFMFKPANLIEGEVGQV